ARCRAPIWRNERSTLTQPSQNCQFQRGYGPDGSPSCAKASEAPNYALLARILQTRPQRLEQCSLRACDNEQAPRAAASCVRPLPLCARRLTSGPVTVILFSLDFDCNRSIMRLNKVFFE